MVIKAIVFDYGGVIEIGKSSVDVASEVLGISADKFRAVYFKYNSLLNVENVPWEEVYAKVVDEFDDRKETIDKVKSAVRESLSENTINTDLVSLFPVLRKQGFKVAILSNAGTDLREKLQKLRIMEMVDDVVISGEIGFQKPHKEAFEVLFNRLQIHSHEAVFIDDSPKSLEKAEEIGYIPILYKNNEQLIADLLQLGINVNSF